MNCLHYSIPGKQSIRNLLEQLPEDFSRSLELKSSDHLSCHRILRESIRSLGDPELSNRRRAQVVGAVSALFEELSGDERVRKNETEYLSLRLLQAEAQCSISEFQNGGDASGFERLISKLKQEFAPAESDTVSSSSGPPVSLTDPSAPRNAPAPLRLGAVLGFLFLLGLLVAGMITVGIFAIGIAS